MKGLKFLSERNVIIQKEVRILVTSDCTIQSKNQNQYHTIVVYCERTPSLIAAMHNSLKPTAPPWLQPTVLKE